MNCDKIICIPSLTFVALTALLFASPWCATYTQSTAPIEHFSMADGLSSSKVFDAAQTADGMIWFATGNGVCRLNGLDFYCYPSDNENAEITGLYIDQNGKLWCWSASNQFFYFDNNRFIPLAANRDVTALLSDRIINSIAIDKENTLWIATVIPGPVIKSTASGVVSAEPQASHSFFASQTGIDFIYGSLKNKEDNNKLGIRSGEEFFTLNLSEKGNFSRTSFRALSNGEFLFAKGQEIIRARKDKVLQRTFTEKNIQDVIVDSEGKIWAGLYAGGALCYPEGDLNSAGSINYLGNKSITSIMEDKSGNIWFTTMDDGIYYLSARTTLRYASPTIYSHKNLSGKEQAKAILAEPATTAPITLQPGFRLITTDAAVQDTVPPMIYISGIRILEKDTLVQAHYSLPYDKNFLKINFAGFAFGNPEALKYKYRLEGVDKNTIYTDHTFAQYTTLPPGNYFFTVSAMNRQGIWSESPATISFTIHPPYWRTWWFISLEIILASCLVAIAFFFRVARIKKREKEKAEISRQMANAELQALRAQMNPHFIFNTLSSIQHFITTQETEGALKYLSKFARLMRKIMDNSKKPSIPVNDELEALNLYLELESLRFKNKFSYCIEVDEEIDVNDAVIPAMLIQPYVENSILHGLNNLAENKKGRLSVKLTKQDEMIICTVEDNGIGREKSAEINRERKKNHISQGMAITKNRLEIHNAMHHSNLNVNITDLKAGTEALGTRVEIFIPPLI